MKIQVISRLRNALAFALTIFALGVLENSAGAQQFRTGVGLTVIQQPGRAYFNPVQQQLMYAMRQRQNALSNYGTAINLQAARVSAYRQQLESYQKAQQAYYQAMIHIRNAQQLRMKQAQNSNYSRYGRR